MRIIVEFDNAAEAAPLLAALHIAQGGGSVTPPVDNAHVEAGAEQFSEAEKPAGGKRKRRTNAEIAAAEAAEAEAKKLATDRAAVVDAEFEDALQTPASDFLDDDDAPPAKEVTKDEVRAALVAYQDRLTGPKPTPEALEKARGTVLGLLSKVGGADKLGALDIKKFGAAVIAAANAAK